MAYNQDVPDHNPDPTTENAKWVTLSYKSSSWEWRNSKDDPFQKATQIRGIFESLGLRWKEGNGKTGKDAVADRWELLIRLSGAKAIVGATEDSPGTPVKIGNAELLVGSPITFYNLGERLQLAEEGMVLNFATRRDEERNTLFVEVHRWDGQQWRALRYDSLKRKLTGESDEKYAKAPDLIRSYSTYISDDGERGGGVPDGGPREAADKPGVSGSVQDGENRAAQRAAASAASVNAQAPAEIPSAFGYRPVKWPNEDAWETPAPDSMLAMEKKEAIKRGFATEDEQADAAACILDALGIDEDDEEKRESKGASRMVYAFFVNATEESIALLRKAMEPPPATTTTRPALPPADEYDPFADE